MRRKVFADVVYDIGDPGYAPDMALTAAQYQAEAEAALTKAKSLVGTTGAAPDKGVVWAQIAQTYVYLFEEQSKIDGTLTI